MTTPKDPKKEIVDSAKEFKLALSKFHIGPNLTGEIFEAFKDAIRKMGLEIPGEYEPSYRAKSMFDLFYHISVLKLSRGRSNIIGYVWSRCLDIAGRFNRSVGHYSINWVDVHKLYFQTDSPYSSRTLDIVIKNEIDNSLVVVLSDTKDVKLMKNLCEAKSVRFDNVTNEFNFDRLDLFLTFIDQAIEWLYSAGEDEDGGSCESIDIEDLKDQVRGCEGFPEKDERSGDYV